MSLHPSLKIDKAGAQVRTILTRIERIKDMMKRGVWTETSDVVGLPKTKIVRLKAKKREKKEETAAAAPGGAAASAAKPAAKDDKAKKK